MEECLANQKKSLIYQIERMLPLKKSFCELQDYYQRLTIEIKNCNAEQTECEQIYKSQIQEYTDISDRMNRIKEKLQQDIVILSKQLIDLINQKKQIEQNIQLREVEMAQLAIKKTNKQGQIANKNYQIEHFQLQINCLQQQNQQMATNINMTTQNNKDIQQQLSYKSNQIIILTQTVRDLGQNIQKVQGINKECETKINQLKIEINNTLKNIQQKEVKKKKGYSQMENLRLKQRSLNNQNQNLQALIKNQTAIKSDLQQSEKRLSKIQQKNDQILWQTQDQIQETQKNINSQNIKYKQNNKKIQLMVSHIDELKKNNKSLLQKMNQICKQDAHYLSALITKKKQVFQFMNRKVLQTQLISEHSTFQILKNSTTIKSDWQKSFEGENTSQSWRKQKNNSKDF